MSLLVFKKHLQLQKCQRLGGKYHISNPIQYSESSIWIESLFDIRLAERKTNCFGSGFGSRLPRFRKLQLPRGRVPHEALHQLPSHTGTTATELSDGQRAYNEELMSPTVCLDYKVYTVGHPVRRDIL